MTPRLTQHVVVRIYNDNVRPGCREHSRADTCSAPDIRRPRWNVKPCQRCLDGGTRIMRTVAVIAFRKTREAASGA
jgi:hypothetical protein